MRYKIILLLAALFALTTSSLHAADNWFMYLFDNVTQELVRVEASGDYQTIPLLLDEGDIVGTSNVAISPDGRSAAYCNTGSGDKMLIVQDLDAGEEQLRVEYGTIPGCIVSGFSADNTTIAVSIINEEPHLPNGEDTAMPDWELRLVNVRDGSVTGSINADNRGIPPFNNLGNGAVPLAMRIIHLTADQALFTAHPFIGMGGPAALPAYRWDLMTNAVTAVGDWANGTAYLPPTGERVQPRLNEAYPAAQPMGPTPQANELVVLGDAGERVIYRNTDEIILSARFVDSGRAVAVHLAAGFNPDQSMDDSGTRFILIERDGTITDVQQEFEGYAEIFAAPGDDGAAVTWTENPQGGGLPPTQLAIIEAGGSLQPFATIPAPDAQGFSPRFFIWAQPITVDELVPFSAID